ERARQRVNEEAGEAEAVAARRPTVGMQRPPVVPDVPHEPGRSGQTGRERDQRRVAPDARLPPRQPGEGGQGNKNDLDARPPAATEHRSEQGRIDRARALSQPQREQNNQQPGQEQNAVVAVFAGRSPDEVRGPDPEQQGGDDGGTLADRAPADSPEDEPSDSVEG